MFFVAIGLGVYAYSLFLIGILGILTRESVLINATFFAVVGGLFLWRQKKALLKYLESFKKLRRLSIFFLFLLTCQAIVNLLGALGPELAFDALWYHLTLPKIYLLHNTISYIPGNLLYYSAMPQLTEMYYIVALALEGEITAKCIHFSFGVLTCIALYLLSFKILKKQLAAIFAIVVFYANLVVGWESTTAFSDLSLTFFTTMSLFAFMLWILEQKQRLLYVSAILLGFAVACKLLAIGTLGIMIALITFVLYKNNTPWVELVGKGALYAAITMLVASPWLLYAYIHTGNPFYPFFSNINPVSGSYVSFDINMIGNVWGTFVTSADPILPIYLLVIPLFFLVRKKVTLPVQILMFFFSMSFLFWYVLPKIGGGRFLLPYLPAYSILVAFVIFSLKEKLLQKFLMGVIILLAVSSIGYRSLANSKYLPVIIGNQAKEQFLAKQLNFRFGDFYDIDGYFAKNITTKDMVLLYGFHNLYYIDFPFIDSTWVKRGDRYNYVAVQGGELPIKHIGAVLVYDNPVTGVSLYNLGRFVAHE